MLILIPMTTDFLQFSWGVGAGGRGNCGVRNNETRKNYLKSHMCVSFVV